VLGALNFTFATAGVIDSTRVAIVRAPCLKFDWSGSKCSPSTTFEQAICFAGRLARDG
jgi:hypothetical protein